MVKRNKEYFLHNLGNTIVCTQDLTVYANEFTELVCFTPQKKMGNEIKWLLLIIIEVF